MLIDIIIIFIVIAAGFRSSQSGFVRQLLATAGLVIGIFAGRYLIKFSLSPFHTPESRAIATIATILVSAMIVMTIGEVIGIKIKFRLHKILNSIDNFAGAIIGALTAILMIWLFASAATSLPASKLKNDVENSSIIQELAKILPSAPSIFKDIGDIIDPNGFPDVFIGSEPIPKGNYNLPTLGSLQSAVNLDKSSVVRIQGEGCGGIVSGSGFVIKSGLIVTNAHVVAGIQSPVVEDSNGNHKGQIVWFDPDLDLAIIKTNGLAGKPLSFQNKINDPGTASAVLGYPGGGQFSASPAVVIDSLEAIGNNIYGTNKTLRSIYELKANVIPGNSGGPLINETGQVIGVVFAKSTTYNQVGYALTTTKVTSEISQAENHIVPVSSGRCAE